MAEYLGFEPIKSGERYYISYTEEDNKKVGSITSYLNMMGVPMWYDHGFSVDYEREAVISKNLVESLAVIIFVSKNAFSDADAYMWTEYIAARNEKKVRYALWLDTVTVSDVDDELKTIYADILRLQEIKITSKLWKPEDIAWKTVRSFSLVWNDERLLECAFSLLKEKKYILAEQYCESVLDKNHRNGRAHLGRMMARLNVQSIEALVECHEPFDGNDDYTWYMIGKDRWIADEGAWLKYIVTDFRYE